MTSVVQNLIDVSRKQEKLYHTFFDRDNYDLSDDQRYMEETLISLYGLPIYDTLTDQQKKKLSKLEASQIIYCYAQSETVMCHFMARYLLELEFGSEDYVFLLREQVEEYRHQDMFHRALTMMGNTYIPITGFLARQARISSKLLSAKWFFLLQIIVELISDDFGKMCYENENVNKLVADVSKFHHIEEARHIVFADQHNEKRLTNMNFLERTFGGIIMALDVHFMNAGYIRHQFYEQIGIADAKKWKKEAVKNYKRNALKNFGSKEGMEIIDKYRLITWMNKGFVKKFTGISR